ncbi:MAG: hypothetical protein IPM32_04640 [Ignavibacteriae bacterium]|nr:hypothetical protein [Ignavibacteriota bacterium]
MVNKNINWINHFIELIVVFIGITAAFALNNWNEGRKDKELEVKYLKSIIEETNANIQNLEKEIKSTEQDSMHNKSAIDLIKSNKFNVQNLFSHIGTMGNISQINTISAAFESIKYSGGFEAISNLNLKNLIIETYELYKKIPFIENITIKFLDKYWTEYVIDKIDLSKNFTYENLKVDRKLKNIIIGFRITIIQQLTTYKETLQKCKELKIALEKELN